VASAERDTAGDGGRLGAALRLVNRAGAGLERARVLLIALAEAGLPGSCWPRACCDRSSSLHRPVSRHLTRAAALWSLSQATARGAIMGIAPYFVSAVLDHVDGEVARLTYAESSR